MTTAQRTSHAKFYLLKKFLSGLFLTLAVLLLLIFILAPVAWLVISSLSSQKELLQMPPNWFPWPPDFPVTTTAFGPAKRTTLTDFTCVVPLLLRNVLIIAFPHSVGTSLAPWRLCFARIKLPLATS